MILKSLANGKKFCYFVLSKGEWKYDGISRNRKTIIITSHMNPKLNFWRLSLRVYRTKSILLKISCVNFDQTL